MRIKKIHQYEAEQRLLLEADGDQFGAFDGYKEDIDGVARFAIADWMEGLNVHTVLWAFEPEDLCVSDSVETRIIPNEKEPDGYKHHRISGQIESIFNGSEEPLNEALLFGDIDKDECGIPVRPFKKGRSMARLTLPSATILVELSERDNDSRFAIGEGIDLKAARTDIIGVLDL